MWKYYKLWNIVHLLKRYQSKYQNFYLFKFEISFLVYNFPNSKN